VNLRKDHYHTKTKKNKDYLLNVFLIKDVLKIVFAFRGLYKTPFSIVWNY